MRHIRHCLSSILLLVTHLAGMLIAHDLNCCLNTCVPVFAIFFVACAESRWVPVKRGAPLSGILVLRDLTPDEPVEYSSSGTAGGPAAPGAAAAAGAAGAAGQQPQQQEQEAAPPAPFGECATGVMLCVVAF